MGGGGLDDARVIRIRSIWSVRQHDKDTLASIVAYETRYTASRENASCTHFQKCISHASQNAFRMRATHIPNAFSATTHLQYVSGSHDGVPSGEALTYCV